MTKHGLKGGYRAGCCDGLDVWGVSSNAPDFQWETESGDDERLSYDLHRGLTNPITSETLTKEIEPELWPRSVNQQWFLYAAKVPSAFPGLGCDKEPLTSSKADSTWSVELCVAGEHLQDESDPAQDYLHSRSYVHASRAITVDGKQAWLSYRTTGTFPPDMNLGTLSDGTVGNPGTNPDFGDHHLIRIADQTKLGSYRVGTANGHLSLFGGSGSAMEEAVFQGVAGELPNVFGGDDVAHSQPPCNCVSHGLRYFVFSTYTPTSGGWVVGRVEYDGQRLDGPTGDWGDGMRFFVSDITNEVGAEGTTLVGDYYIVLPTCRVNLDSGSAETHDECWVLAIHKTTGVIVTGQWREDVFRTTGGTDKETEWYHYADGTLHADDVVNVILDPADPPEDLDETEWDNLRILAYNRVWDAANGECKDLVLFTTHADGEGYSVASDVVSDFEQPGSPDSTFLDSGLEAAGLSWETGGLKPTDGWISDNTDAIDGSYSAKTQFEDVTIIDDVVLRILFHAVEAGDITVNYRFDNRWYGTRIPPFEILTNFPDPDNYLDVRLDGALLSGSDFKIEGVDQSTSRIDNATVPGAGDEESDYTTVREITIHVEAGTHTLSFTCHRQYQDNGHMVAQIDSVAFGMDVMVGEDINGKRRWLHNGDRVQEIPWWAWPRRDEESAEDITNRVTTIPNFVTMDGSGNILYGNSHYDVRLRRREDDATLFEPDPDFGGPRGDGFPEQGGFVRYTASPNIEMADEPPCDDPDDRVIEGDSISDPPWGGTQLMPVGRTNYQKRGANGTLRDATDYPYESTDWPYKRPTTGHTNYERFAELTRNKISGGWSQRAHGWTVTDNGKHRTPHVEVVWRPTRYVAAWPGPESEWTHPPYQSNFVTSTEDDALDAIDPSGNMRMRNPLFLPPSSEAPRWPMTNFIVPATYSDSLSQFPQMVWTRQLGNDPPSDDEDPAWFDPDVGNGAGIYAWPSAQWHLVQARFTPTGFYRMYIQTEVVPEAICPDGEVEKASVIWRQFFVSAPGGNTFYGFTDFEAVDCDCDCCG